MLNMKYHVNYKNMTAMSDQERLKYIYTCYVSFIYIQDTSYHISFFWCLGDKRDCLKELLPSLTSSLNNFLAENMEDAYMHANEVQCKIGNKCYTFELK